MAKSLSLDQQAILNDFNTPPSSLPEIDPLNPPEVDENAPRTRRKKSKLNIHRVSAYLTPVQYKMLDEMARQENCTLTDMMAHCIENTWDTLQRQAAKLAPKR